VIGQVFSHYRIEEYLGSGKMGDVYLGRDLNLGRPVAIKFVAAALSADEKAAARFMREAQAVAMLDHPNICAIYEIDRSADGRVCIVMAHYGGETLERRMAAGPLAATDAVEIAIQVVRGLECAHARVIVHRDIKPSNIMLTASGLVKILDFGLAKLPESLNLTASQSAIGTPRYMSPEQVSGSPIDPRADLWSVGVLLHAMLTGHDACPGDSAPALFYAILNTDPSPLAASLAEVPAGLQEIVDRCLAKDLEKRYPDAAALLADLSVVQRRLAPKTLETSVSEERAREERAREERAREEIARKRARRRKMIGIGAALVALAIGVPIAWRLLVPAEPLRVAVLPPQFTASRDSEEVAAAAASAQIGLMRGLISLRGIAVDPSDLRAKTGTPVEIARTLSVRELVEARLDGAGADWHVLLSRLSGADGQVLWADEFMAPKDDRQLLAEAMSARIVAGFKDHRPRRGAEIPHVDKMDFEELIRLKNAILGVGAEHLTEAQIYQRVKVLCGRSPNFLDAQLLYAEWARRMYLVSSDPHYLQESQSAAERAQRIAPWDRRPLSRQFNNALDVGQLDRADALLTAMRRLDPGNVQNLLRESDLADRRGQGDRAITLLQEVVRRQPSRDNLKNLANREVKYGLLQPARAHLDTLIRRNPEDPWPHSKMAELELYYGSRARAESIYVDLLQRGPNIIYLWNLGLSREFQWHFEDAVAAYRQTLELAPGNIDVNINLAECEIYLGREDAAARRFRQTLDLLKKSPSASGPKERIQAAHCLVRLGQRQEAVAAIQEALPRSGDDTDQLFAATMVYAIAGERSSTIVNTRRAIEKGLSVRWFSLPPFESLRGDPEFTAALATREAKATQR